MASRDGASPARWLPDILLLIAAFAATGAARAWLAPFVAVSPDSVDPLLRAFHVLDGADRWPTPHAPQFGPALAWLQLPLVAGADSLATVFRRMLWLQGLTAALVYAGVRWGLGARPPLPTTGDAPAVRRWTARLAATAAAAAVAAAHGPLGSLPQTFETYQAPELSAAIVAAMALALLRGARAGVPAALALLPLAIAAHPMALALLPGTLVVAGWRAARGEGRWIAAGAVAAVVLALPQLAQLAALALDSGRGGDAITAVARSAAAGAAPTVGGLLRSVIHAEAPPLGWTLPAAPLAGLLAAALARHSAAARLAAWTLAAQASLVGIGLVAGYLQPYHGRVLLAAAALQLGAVLFLAVRGVARLVGGALPGRLDAAALPTAARVVAAALACGALAAGLGLAAAGSVHRWRDLRPDGGDVARHAAIAGAIGADAGDGPRWIEILSLGGPRAAWGYAPALYLEQRLTGTGRAWFRADGPLYLVVHGPAPRLRAALAALDDERVSVGVAEVARLAGDADVERALVRARLPAASRLWLATCCDTLGGEIGTRQDAGELLAYTDPGREPAIRAWFDACVLGSGAEVAGAEGR